MAKSKAEYVRNGAKISWGCDDRVCEQIIRQAGKRIRDERIPDRYEMYGIPKDKPNDWIVIDKSNRANTVRCNVDDIVQAIIRTMSPAELGQIMCMAMGKRDLILPLIENTEVQEEEFRIRFLKRLTEPKRRDRLSTYIDVRDSLENQVKRLQETVNRQNKQLKRLKLKVVKEDGRK